MISELQGCTHGFEKVNTENAGHSIVIDDLYPVAVYAILSWYSEL